MKSFFRILILAKRYLTARFFKVEELIDFSFWPVMDILIWGGVGVSLAQKHEHSPQILLSIMSVVMLRMFLYSYFNHATNFLYEMMSRNIINLFSTPISFREWLCAAMMSGTVTSLSVFTYATIIAKAFFNVSLFSIGLKIFLYIIPLLICGWATAHMAILLLMYFGVHAQRLVWVVGWVGIPFSGAYYALDTMPFWIQTLSYGVPMSYVFKGLRMLILEDYFSVRDLVYSYTLALIYFIVTIIACNRMFERSRQLGLASLERS